MKAIVPLAGHATRLNGLVDGSHKTFLNVSENTRIIDVLLKELNLSKKIDEIVFITDESRKEVVLDLMVNTSIEKSIRLIVEPAPPEGFKKIGAGGALKHAIDKIGGVQEQGVLIVGSDNLIPGFDFDSFIGFSKNSDATIALYETTDLDNIHNFGTAKLSQEGIVENFFEKKSYDVCKTNKVSTLIYWWSENFFNNKVKPSVEDNNGVFDNPGSFYEDNINFLIKGYSFKTPWVDVGRLEQLEQAKDLFKKN